MNNKDCFVSVIVPLYNDSRIITIVIDEIVSILKDHYQFYELILINDASEDDTAQQVEDSLHKYSGLRLINLSRHFGTEVAISSGLDTAIGDFIVILLPYCDPPQLIPQLIQQCQVGKDILIGVRKHRLDDPLWMRLGVNLFYWTCQHLLHIPLTKNATQFRVLSRQVVNALTYIPDNYCYLRLLSAYVGYRSQTFTYTPIKRYKKVKKRSLIASINLGLQIIFMNSAHPLRLASYLTIVASGFNLLYMFYIVLVYLIKNKVAEGWVTLSMQNAMMFFFIYIILGIICEYIGLIFARSRGWATYYIADEKNSSVFMVDQDTYNVVHESKDMKI